MLVCLECIDSRVKCWVEGRADSGVNPLGVGAAADVEAHRLKLLV